jgi:bacillithiol system protein YtxJ
VPSAKVPVDSCATDCDLGTMNNVREIETEDQMRLLLEESKTRMVVLFKYSPTCSISLTVQEKWDAWTESAPEGLILAQCDVIGARPAARGITTWVDILHQSPQVLVLEGGKCLKQASHYSIDGKWLDTYAG